ncbi:MAG: transposase [Steroidobacteraceae bacterium]|nr:transposase [Steroidobacteraceae bacterium]
MERMIGTIRREYLDHTFLGNSIDLQRKLDQFQTHYNRVRIHRSLNGTTAANRTGNASSAKANLVHHARERRCNRLIETPVAA